jgi:ketosteroid isomerase-like protein
MSQENMAFVLAFVDGKVTALRTYTDIAEARRQAGQTE